MVGDGSAVAVLVVDRAPGAAAATAAKLGAGSDRIETTIETEASAVRRAVAAESPDCIVTTYELDGTDGVALVEELRADEVAVPVVMVPAAGSEAVASRALAAGATDYVPRGDLDPNALAERVIAAAEAESPAEALEAFVRMVGHDLRNPLSVAAGWLDLLAESGDPEHHRRAMAALERMEEILEDLSALARTETAILDRGKVDLSNVATAAWSTVDAADAELQVEYGPAVRADRSKLQQLLENLFRNAVEHGGANVTVSVGITADGRGFQVEDDGSGIPVADRDLVFEQGYSTGDDGTGIGLVIVQRIAEAHGWETAIEESETGGARFIFRGVSVLREEPAGDVP